MSTHSDLSIVRHSAAHLLAHALMELFPDIILTLGPATKEGFFYDVLAPRSLKEDDLGVIAIRMQEIVVRDLALEHTQISKDTARELYKSNPFKLELIDQIAGETVGLATQGAFYDLCRGGHVQRTGELAHFKLLHISGSYWRADKNNTALQRITGTAFRTAQELHAYDIKQTELARYDHRVLGKQMDLFSFHPEGVGFPFFHPKGMIIIEALKQEISALQRRYHYQQISTPALLHDSLWRRSGHYDHYRENMYFSEVDKESYAIKPMNCPGAILTYKTRPRSYRELPLKLAEFGHVHRHELSGVLHGLLRVRAFTQDDAHIFCMADQIEAQVTIFIAMIQELFSLFGFSAISYMVATRPASSLGSDEAWSHGTNALESALGKLGIAYTYEKGGGAFYGPKIAVYLEDSHGRQWQCSTIQVDFFQADNFDLSYVASSGQRERPVILHQANYGSIERFFAILLEHYKGNLPLWLAPDQVRVLPLTDEQHAPGLQWKAFLQEKGVRIDIDMSGDPLSGKIKNAISDRVQWMIIIGKKEAESHCATVRLANGKQYHALNKTTLWEQFCKSLHESRNASL